MTQIPSFKSQCEPALGWLYRQALPLHLPDYSLIFVVEKSQAKVLLGWKKRGFGARLWNGFGGKPEAGESMLNCARRELEEESGLMPTNDGIYLKGEILMSRPAADAKESGCTGLRIHVYICESWDGEAIEQVLKHNLQRRVPDARTEEMLPAWYNIADQNLTASAGKGDRNLPLDEMWPEASIFLRPLLMSVLTEERSVRLNVYSEYQILPIDSVEDWQCLAVSHSIPCKDSARCREILAGWDIQLKQE